MVRLRLAAGLAASHVPFLDAGGINDSSQDASTFILHQRSTRPLLEDGKIKVLAVSSTTRLTMMPDVPTLAEAGLPAALYNFWVGAFAPANTPQPIVEQLNRQIVAALKVKSVVENINALGGVPDPMTIKEFETFIADEIAVNAEIVKNIRLHAPMIL